MQFQKIILIGLASFIFVSQVLVAEASNGFTDTVILKDGTTIEGVKATEMSEGLLVTTEDGKTTIYNEKEVESLKKVGDNENVNFSESDSTSTKPAKPFKSKLGIEFVPIPAGEFLMGCSTGDKECDDSEKPVHKVKIKKGFYMGKYEVTQAQWKAVMKTNPSKFNSCGENCPVERVSWEDIQEFLHNLNEKEGRTGERKIRLPTEAEWEYAVRAGSWSKTYATDLGSIAWYKKNSGNKTHPVGKKKPNSFGLYDMIGNVWEWVDDRFDESYYATSEIDDPKGSANGEKRVIRGGSWEGDPPRYSSSLRSAYIPAIPPQARLISRFVFPSLGFRLVSPQN